MRIVRHLHRLLKLYGRDVIFRRGAVEHPTRALLTYLDPAQMHTYFDDSEVMTMIRPALIGTVEGVTDVAVNDTLALDGRTFAVKKIVQRYLGNEIVSKTLLLD